MTARRARALAAALRREAEEVRCRAVDVSCATTYEQMAADRARLLDRADRVAP